MRAITMINKSTFFDFILLPPFLIRKKFANTLVLFPIAGRLTSTASAGTQEYPVYLS